MNVIALQPRRPVADSRVAFQAGRLDTVQPVGAPVRPGALLLVRHGESAANERNVFAGIDDVPLTAFGRAQARTAARRFAALGVRFDEIHTSRLGRARETARIIATAAPACFPEGLRWVTGADALDERDFGAFTGRNRNLAARAVGCAEFEAMLHDPARRPPAGESSGALHARVRDYYETVLAPARRAGRNVLVVAHECVLEAMVLVAAGRAPGGCFDGKVPDSTPIAFEALPRFAEGGRRGMRKLGDYVTAHAIELAAIAALAGVALRLATGAALPGNGSLVAMLALLAGAAFLASLEVDLRAAVSGRGFGYLGQIAGRWLPRIAAGGALMCLGGPAWGIVGALLVTPPVTAAPVLARLWGGDGRRAGLETVLASVLVPAAVAGAAFAGCLPAGIPFAPLGSACALIVVATIAAQAVRATAKTAAPAFARRFGWLGPVLLAAMAALGAYQLAPVGGGPGVGGPGVGGPGVGGPGVGGPGVGGLVLPALAFVAVRFALGALSGLATRGQPMAERRDARIAQQNPNVFLWIAVAVAGDAATGFAFLAAFLACLVAENACHVERERSHLLAALPQPQPPPLKAA